MVDNSHEFINDLGRLSSGQDAIRVYERGTPEYEKAIVHRFPNGISEVTRFVVEPGSEIALRVLFELLEAKKASFGISIPFGLKSGGHISIPKINAPKEGILISMQRFNHIDYDKEKKTLDVGAGVIWRDVYKYLESFASDASDHAPGVVGGDPLVGVSGWLLGGGYSLLTNRFGLGIDNVIRFRILLPAGKGVCDVSGDPKEHPDLFMALKGGGHNFGIITQFTLRVHNRAKRTDHILSVEFPKFLSNFVKAGLVALIQDETPPEEVAVAAFRHDLTEGKIKSYIPFYVWWTGDSSHKSPDVSEKRNLAQFFFSGSDGVKSSSLQSQSPRSMSLAEAYEAFSLRHLPVSLETLQSDSHFVHLDASSEIKKDMRNADLIETKLFTSHSHGERGQIDWKSLTVFTAGDKKVVMERPPDLRGRMASIMVTTYTRTLIDEAEKQAEALSLLMAANKGIRVSYEIWPFHKDAFKGVKQEDSAWPHEEGKVFGPLVGWFEWSGKDNDKFWLAKISNSLSKLRQVALEENCTTKNLPMYLNITLEDTSVKDIYRDHYEKLKHLRRVYDPNDVMRLAAGFVIDTSEA